MPFQLSDEQLLTRSAVREFAEAEILPIAAEIDRDHRAPLESIPKMGAQGLLGMIIPEKYEGAGSDYLSYMIAIEEVSRVCGTHGVMIEAHTSLASYPILHFGTEEQKMEFLPDLATGRKMGAFGLTEPEAGSDAANLKTTAVRDGDDWVINGQKIFITGGGYAKTFVVFARTNPDVPSHKGISAFIIDRDTPGFTIGENEQKLGIRGSSTTPLMFSDVRVPNSRMLGQPGQGFEVAMNTLDGGRTGIAAQALGIAQGAFEAALKYAQERVQFGKPLTTKQAIQRMLADMSTDLAAGRLLVYEAADLEDRGEEYAIPAARAKLFCGPMASRVTTQAIQIHGGNGYIMEYPVERMFRDARITEIYEGTNEVQRLVIAKSLLR
ncbi:MAG: acyl-CoA dehydrogenase [Propionibacteriaceae bacterium]|jgi:alkylation response protein AidB-like acyl-CoA dehydrogenase|nr:acyl-CoA dehydrogenase [Propionibacteriaceae bacterium]